MNETEHLLTVLVEECAEVAQVACKAIRFGLSDCKPGQSETNRRMLEREMADLTATADLLGLHIRDEDKAVKLVRLQKFMAYAREVGTLDAPDRLAEQNQKYQKALKEIYELEGPGLDGSSENASGRIARLALEGASEARQT